VKLYGNEHSNIGCASTITADPTAASVTNHPQAAYPRQPDQRYWAPIVCPDTRATISPNQMVFTLL
jgi:hypothetical protein